MLDRRIFFKILLGVPFLGSAFGKKYVEKKKKEFFINHFYIAGFQYYKGPGMLHLLEIGKELKMSAQSDNPHDRYAVEVSAGDVKIGYVPRTDNKHISRLLRKDFPMLCKIEARDPEAPLWEQLKVAVYILSDEPGV